MQISMECELEILFWIKIAFLIDIGLIDQSKKEAEIAWLHQQIGLFQEVIYIYKSTNLKISILLPLSR